MKLLLFVFSLRQQMQGLCLSPSTYFEAFIFIFFGFIPQLGAFGYCYCCYCYCCCYCCYYCSCCCYCCYCCFCFRFVAVVDVVFVAAALVQFLMNLHLLWLLLLLLLFLFYFLLFVIVCGAAYMDMIRVSFFCRYCTCRLFSLLLLKQQQPNVLSLLFAVCCMFRQRRGRNRNARYNKFIRFIIIIRRRNNNGLAKLFFFNRFYE